MKKTKTVIFFTFALFLCAICMIMFTACDSGDSSQTQDSEANSVSSTTQAPEKEHVHAFTGWINTKKATCREGGEQKRTCFCGEKETRNTPVTDHSWREATCTAPKTCTVCGETSGTALGHTCAVGVCERCKEHLTPTINLPSTPINDIKVIYLSFHDSVQRKMNLLSITYEFDVWGDLNFCFSGEKTYDIDGPTSSTPVSFVWKLLDDEGFVVASGTAFTDQIKVGEKFKNKEFHAYSFELDPKCTSYTLVIEDDIH